MFSTHRFKGDLGVVLALVGSVVSPACQAQQAPPQPKNATTHRQPAIDGDGKLLPKGAVARLGTLHFRHGEVIGGVAVSADGKLLGAWKETA
jgi:hypothetical protein